MLNDADPKQTRRAVAEDRFSAKAESLRADIQYGGDLQPQLLVGDRLIGWNCRFGARS